MFVETMHQLGARARQARLDRGLTQAQLAGRLGASRDWVIRLEQGHTRLEAQLVLDALVLLGLTIDVEDDVRPPAPDPFPQLRR